MSSGRLPEPRSAIVVPFTLRAGLQVADRDLHQRRAGVGRENVLLALNRVGNEGPHRRFGLKAPCEACQICTVAPLAACVKGYGIERSAEDHSSFERPATITLPFTKAMSVIVCVRALPPGAWWRDLRRIHQAHGGVLDVVQRSAVILPEPSHPTISGTHPGPCRGRRKYRHSSRWD